MDEWTVVVLNFVQRNWFFLVIIAALLFALRLQRRRGIAFSSIEEFEALLKVDQPLVVEYFDNT